MQTVCTKLPIVATAFVDVDCGKLHHASMTESFAKRLRGARVLKGLTQQDVADRIQISRAAVGQWELGKSRPSVRNMRRLDDLLHTAFTIEEGNQASEALESFVNSLDNSVSFGEPSAKSMIPLSFVAAGPRAELYRNSFENSSEPKDFVSRPTSLWNEPDAYGILIATDALDPRFEADNIAYVRRPSPAKEGEYAVIQAKTPDGKPNMYIRRVLHLFDDDVVLGGLKDGQRQVVPRSMIEGAHRIVPWVELIGFTEVE